MLCSVSLDEKEINLSDFYNIVLNFAAICDKYNILLPNSHLVNLNLVNQLMFMQCSLYIYKRNLLRILLTY